MRTAILGAAVLVAMPFAVPVAAQETRAQASVEASADAREVWRNSELRVLARTVHHEPVTPAVAYRVETPDGAVVIDGVVQLRVEGGVVLVRGCVGHGAVVVPDCEISRRLFSLFFFGGVFLPCLSDAMPAKRIRA